MRQTNKGVHTYMRLTEIKVEQKSNTGQYESLTVTVSAAIDEEDNMAEAANKVTNFIDWFARKPIRDAQLFNKRRLLNDPQATEDAKAEAQKWIEKYEARKKEIEGM